MTPSDEGRSAPGGRDHVADDPSREPQTSQPCGGGSAEPPDGRTDATRDAADRSARDLLARHVAGDAAAFPEFVSRHHGLVAALCVRRGSRLRGFATFEDVADETWYQVLRAVRAGTVPGTRRVSAWVGGICLNVISSTIHRRESAGGAGPDDAPDGPERLADAGSPDPADVVAEAEQIAAVRACVERLDGRLRDLHDALYVLGETNVAAAQRLGCTEANVRLKLRPRLEETLARCLAQRGFRGGAREGGSNR